MKLNANIPPEVDKYLKDNNLTLRPVPKPKVNTLVFILTFPSNNSWNGIFSGEGNLYCVVIKPAQKTIDKILGENDAKDYRYNFGDGWVANVEVKKMTSQQARKFKKESRGFMGYNWMIEDIICCQKILSQDERKQKLNPTT